MSKTIATHKNAKFTQTHATDGHIWVDVGGISMPLSMSFDEDGGRYAYFYEVDATRENRVYLLSEEDFNAL